MALQGGLVLHISLLRNYGFSASTPSAYVAGVITCLDKERFAPLRPENLHLGEVKELTQNTDDLK